MPVIVGTDFSDPARAAAEAAASLAQKLQETLVLVHVREPSPASARDQAFANVAGASERLSLEAGRLRSQGFAVEEALLDGNPDEALVDYADRVRARLIVTGALGWRSPVRWRIGSVVDRIAQACRCPLLVVRSQAAFVEWARGGRPLRASVCDDISSPSEAALRWLADLKRAGAVEETVVHAYWPPGESARLGSPAHGPPDMDAIVARDLRARLDALGQRDAAIRVVGSFGRAAEPLIATASAERADLLVLGTHQRKGPSRLWYGSVSQTALHLAPMSVALVPAAEAADAVPVPVPQVSRVLVSTDFSAVGNLAIAHACSILPAGGQLVLTHVIESIESVYAQDWGAPASKRGVAADDEAKATRRLEALIPPDAAARGITVVLEVLYGFPVARAICQAAERHGAEVICIGSHGRSGAARLVLGSVAQDVMARSRRPVLVIRPPRS